jgi:hypothetical protein
MGDNGNTQPTRHDTADKLRFEVIQVTIEGIRAELTAIRALQTDHENRIRKAETAVTKFDFLLYLTMGGGLVSLFDLIMLAYLLTQVMAAP